MVATAMQSVRTVLRRPYAHLAGLAITVLVVQQFVESSSSLFLVQLMALYALAALGLNIILGMAGLLSVAQAAVMALGGYTAGLLMIKAQLPFVVALLVAGAASAVLSAFVGLAALRISSHYFILVTLAVAEALSLLLINEEDLTGGYNGIGGIPPLVIGGLDLSSPLALAVVAIVTLFIGWYVADALAASRSGHGIHAGGADPQLAMASGINVARLRFGASVTGGVYAGVAGALYAETLLYLGPGDFSLGKALLILLIVVIGGMGSNAGTVAAAVILVYLSEGLLRLTTVGPLVYGLGIMVILVIAPNGLDGVARRLRRAFGRILERRVAR
ncbi:MAG: hypothetical protein GEU93_20790 [Propionibacteriales bacterium]|nr:hypothetical protein [Propionibacteriales bacterium]